MNNRIINRGGVLRYAKYEYLFDNKLDNVRIVDVIQRFANDPLFRANTYINWLQQPKKAMAKKHVRNLLFTKYHMVIGDTCKIGYHFRTLNPEGDVIGEGVTIGDCCTIGERVTFGQKDGLSPRVGNNVQIEKSSIIIGNIIVGDGATVEEGSVVIEEVQANTVVKGVPAKAV